MIQMVAFTPINRDSMILMIQDIMLQITMMMMIKLKNMKKLFKRINSIMIKYKANLLTNSHNNQSYRNKMTRSYNS